MRNQKLKRALLLAVATAAMAANPMAQEAAPAPAKAAAPEKPPQVDPAGAPGGAAQSTPAKPAQTTGAAAAGVAPQPTQPNPIYKMDPDLAKRYGLTPTAATNPNPPGQALPGAPAADELKVAPRQNLALPRPPAPPTGAGGEPTPALPPGVPPGNPEMEDWDALLASGIWEEEVNGSLDKAVEAYSKVLGNYDQRRLAAGQAMFRLAEGYRKLGYLEEARVLYGRVMREFADLPELVEPSQGHMRVTPGAMAARRVTRLAPPAKPPQAGGGGFAWVPNHPLLPLPEPAGGSGAVAEPAPAGGGMAAGVGGGASFGWAYGGGGEETMPSLPAEVVAKLKEMDTTALRNALSVTHPDPLLRQLIQGLLEAERELEERSTDLGREHPSQQKTAALIKALHQQIDDRAAAILAGLELMASARRTESGGAALAASSLEPGQDEQRKILARQLDIQKLRLEEVRKRKEVGAASSEMVWEAEMRVLEVEKELTRLPRLQDLPHLAGMTPPSGGGYASTAPAPPTPSAAPSALPAPAPAPAMAAPRPLTPPVDRVAQLRISGLEESIQENQRALREVESELERTTELHRLIQTTAAEELPLDLVKDPRFLQLRDALAAALRAQRAGAEGEGRMAVEVALAQASDRLKFWVDNDYKKELEKKMDFLEQRRQSLAERLQVAFKRMELEAEMAKAQAAQ